METNEIIDSNFNEYKNDGNPINLISSRRFILFYILSFGLYGFWWMYKMWSFFKQKESLYIWPVARAIFGIFFIYRLFEKIMSFARSNGKESDYSSESLAGCFIIFYFFSRLPNPYWMISLFAFLFCIQPINVFNEAILISKTYDGTIDAKYNGIQLGFLIFGIIYWILMLLALFTLGLLSYLFP